MANKLMGIEVKGRNYEWGFTFYGDPKYIPEWRADGLEVDLIENIIPEWVADLGMVRLWCFWQDVFNFRNPWRK